MLELFQFEFMQHAVLAGFLTAVACGIIGTLVVVNRIVFIAGGIAHAAYGGIGIAIFLGLSPFLGAGFFAVAVAMVIGIMTLRDRNRSDTVIGVLWAAGMAAGIIFIDLSPGYGADLMSYLFGSIMAVPVEDLYMMAVLDLVIVASTGLFYHDFLAISYDEEFAQLRGLPVKGLYLYLLAMVAVTVVMTIRVVGLILVIALLTIPTFMAEKLSTSLAKMMVISALFSSFFMLAGLMTAYHFDISSGAAIIAVAVVCFALFQLTRKLRGRFVTESRA